MLGTRNHWQSSGLLGDSERGHHTTDTGLLTSPGSPMLRPRSQETLSHAHHKPCRDIVNTTRVYNFKMSQQLRQPSMLKATVFSVLISYSALCLRGMQLSIWKKLLPLLDLTSDLAFKGSWELQWHCRDVIIAPVRTLKTFMMHLFRIDIQWYQVFCFH